MREGQNERKGEKKKKRVDQLQVHKRKAGAAFFSLSFKEMRGERGGRSVTSFPAHSQLCTPRSARKNSTRNVSLFDWLPRKRKGKGKTLIIFGFTLRRQKKKGALWQNCIRDEERCKKYAALKKKKTCFLVAVVPANTHIHTSTTEYTRIPVQKTCSK